MGYAPLAAAVSNAGGLGMVTALTQPTPEALREEIQLCKSLCDKYVAVDTPTSSPSNRPPAVGAGVQLVAVCE